MRVSVSKLDHHPLNREIYSLSTIDDLVSSIEEVGLLQPLVIWPFPDMVAIVIRSFHLKPPSFQRLPVVDNSVSCAGVLRCSAYAIGRWFPVRPPDSGTNVDSDSRHGTFR